MRGFPRVAVALGAALLLAGCGRMVSSLPVVGLPSDVPPPAADAAWPAIHDMPPERRETLLDPSQQAGVMAGLAQAQASQQKRLAGYRAIDTARDAAEREKAAKRVAADAAGEDPNSN